MELGGEASQSASERQTAASASGSFASATLPPGFNGAIVASLAADEVTEEKVLEASFAEHAA